MNQFANNHRMILLALAVLALHISGCGSGPSIAEVTGRVTLDGAPLENANVMFLPEAGGRPGTARTGLGGRYELIFDGLHKGALIGRHEVRITTAYPPSQEFEKGKLVVVPARPERLPDRYHSETNLTVDVRSGQNLCDFELKSK